jgi:hypothetical protein
MASGAVTQEPAFAGSMAPVLQTDPAWLWDRCEQLCERASISCSAMVARPHFWRGTWRDRGRESTGLLPISPRLFEAGTTSRSATSDGCGGAARPASENVSHREKPRSSQRNLDDRQTAEGPEQEQSTARTQSCHSRAEGKQPTSCRGPETETWERAEPGSVTRPRRENEWRGTRHWPRPRSAMPVLEVPPLPF